MGQLLEKYNATTRSDEAAQTFKKPVLPSKAAKNAPTTMISRDAEAQDASAAAPTAVKSHSRLLKRTRYSLPFSFFYQHTDRSLVMMACFRIRKMLQFPQMSIFLSIIRRNVVTRTFPLVNRVLSLRSSVGLRPKFCLQSHPTHEHITNRRS